MSCITLNNGQKFPIIGFGTWQCKPGEVGRAVINAIEAGYRHLDCAFIYGNEAEIGEALQEVFEKGVVRRQDLFIVSKLWNTKHHPSDVRPSLQESLSRLKLAYLDLYLIHWPMCFKAGDDNFPKDDEGNLIFDDVNYLKTWKELESCVDEGLIKSIGLSNFNSLQIKDVIENSRIKPAVLQVELHPYLQQTKLVDFCHEHGVAVTSYSSFGSPATTWYHRIKNCNTSILDDPVLVSIANKYKKSPAQVILRWLIQRNVAAIPKSISPSRIQENFQVFDFELTSDDMKSIRSLNKNHRYNAPIVERDGKEEFLEKDAPYFPFFAEF